MRQKLEFSPWNHMSLECFGEKFISIYTYEENPKMYSVYIYIYMIWPFILKVSLCEWETSGTNSTVSYSIEQKNNENKQIDEKNYLI